MERRSMEKSHFIFKNIFYYLLGITRQNQEMWGSVSQRRDLAEAIADAGWAWAPCFNLPSLSPHLYKYFPGITPVCVLRQCCGNSRVSVFCFWATHKKRLIRGSFKILTSFFFFVLCQFIVRILEQNWSLSWCIVLFPEVVISNQDK